jgi:hypothetical protein
MTTFSKMTCPICHRRVRVLDPNNGVSKPWFVKHVYGKNANRDLGQTPRTLCLYSYISVPSVV